MTTQYRAHVENVFKAVEALDLKTVMQHFAEDAVLFDPHYPKPRMVGKAEIEKGLTWGMGAMQKMGFPIVNYWENAAEGKIVVEIATAHVLKNGMKLNFPQVFVIELRDNLVTRMQAYEPYGPHGINMVVLGITRLIWKLTGK